MDELTTARYEPCTALGTRHTPYVIWFEDALRCYQVPTSTFDLYLLVNDLDEAAKILMQLGWTVSHASARIGNAAVQTKQRRLIPPANTVQPKTYKPLLPSELQSFPVETVLLLAEDWHFDISTSSSISRDISIPQLPALLDSLIDVLLDDPLSDSMYWLHIACQIGYLYEYSAEVRAKDFSTRLKTDHRQYHLDALSGMSTGTLPWIRRQRRIRNALREGTWKLRDCSLSRDDKGNLDAPLNLENE